MKIYSDGRNLKRQMYYVFYESFIPKQKKKD